MTIGWLGTRYSCHTAGVATTQPLVEEVDDNTITEQGHRIPQYSLTILRPVLTILVNNSSH